MNKILLSALAATLLFTSCSKKDSVETKEEVSTSSKITINGTDYPTVKIGNKTWTSVNYNGAGGINYDNSTTNDPQYGKLYSLAEAKAITLPTGWRLPTKDDVAALMAAAGTVKTEADGSLTITAASTTKLRSKTGWTRTAGDNSLGFNAFPGGDLFTFSSPTRDVYSDKGLVAEFWTSTAGPDFVNAGATVKTNWTFFIYNRANTPTDDYGELYNASYANLSKVSVRFVTDN